MPSSTNRHLSNAVEAIRTSDAKTVLDVGVGSGKWGLLCREYLDIFQGRTKPDEWQAKIYGVEPFARYIAWYPWLLCIYDEIYSETIQTVFKTLGSAQTSELEYCPISAGVDLIIAGDVIEHIEKEAAVEVLRGLAKLTQKRLIISIPLGERWLDNVVPNENELEKHKSTWTIGDIDRVMVAAGLKPIPSHVIEEPKGSIYLGIFDR